MPKLTAQQAQARCLQREIAWFAWVLARRFNIHFEKEEDPDLAVARPVPDLADDQSAYARQVRHFELDAAERLVVILALIPHFSPEILDPLFLRNKALDRPHCEFGGWLGKQHGGFLPTLETAVFLLAGYDLEDRLAVLALFEQDHKFSRERLLSYQQEPGEPFASCPLELTPEAFDLFTIDEHRPPLYSIRFPAHPISSQLEWDDLVLAEKTMAGLEDLFAWVTHGKTILEDWGLGRFIPPGYRTLFYGPPGTGKTLAASLIGKRAGMQVFRIDLAAVVSKYIGETEKNLAALFERGRAKNWILFFDEADALFAKRTTVATANDRHGNQEVAYLLQSIENYPGVVILATNLKTNLDEAFARRFQSQVHFTMPGAEQRLSLWQNSLRSVPHEGLDLEKLAAGYELTGSEITTVLRKAALEALISDKQVITADILAWTMQAMGKRPLVLPVGVLDAFPRPEPRRRNGIGALLS